MESEFFFPKKRLLPIYVGQTLFLKNLSVRFFKVKVKVPKKERIYYFVQSVIGPRLK